MDSAGTYYDDGSGYYQQDQVSLTTLTSVVPYNPNPPPDHYERSNYYDYYSSSGGNGGGQYYQNYPQPQQQPQPTVSSYPYGDYNYSSYNYNHYSHSYDYQNYNSYNYDYYRQPEVQYQQQTFPQQSEIVPHPQQQYQVQSAPVVAPLPQKTFYSTVDYTCLFNPSILKCILGHSTLKDAKSARLVSKQWDKVARTMLRERICIRLDSPRQITRFCGAMKRCWDMDYSACFHFGPRLTLRQIQNPELVKILKTCLRDLEIQSLAVVDFSSLKRLLLNLPLITTLSLPTSIFASKNISEEHCDLKLPSLKSLTFARDSIDPTMEYPGAQHLLSEFLSMCSNLEELRIVGPLPVQVYFKYKGSTLFSQELLDNPTSILDACLWSALRETSAPLKQLKMVDMKLQLNNNCVHSLSAKQFPLDSVDLQISPNVTNNSLLNLLGGLRETLRSLKLHYCGEGRMTSDTGIHSKQHDASSLTATLVKKINIDLSLSDTLPKVKTLVLEKYDGSMSFVEKLPNLLSLTFSKCNLTKVVLKEAHLGPLHNSESINPNLQILKVFNDSSSNTGSNRQRSVQTVQKLGLQFPSVRKLRLERLIDESFCLLPYLWPNVEELEVVKGRFTDAATTSIHPNAYKVILREGAYDNFNVDALRQGLYLGNLARLTSLKIGSTGISDVTLILGIAPCPNLKELCVKKCNITDHSLYHLLSRSKITNLRTKDCFKLTTTATSYLAKKLEERGGTSSLNKPPQRLNIFKSLKFLERYPQPQVTLNKVHPPKPVTPADSSVQVIESKPETKGPEEKDTKSPSGHSPSKNEYSNTATIQTPQILAATTSTDGMDFYQIASDVLGKPGSGQVISTKRMRMRRKSSVSICLEDNAKNTKRLVRKISVSASPNRPLTRSRVTSSIGGQLNGSSNDHHLPLEELPPQLLYFNDKNNGESQSSLEKCIPLLLPESGDADNTIDVTESTTTNNVQQELRPAVGGCERLPQADNLNNSEKLKFLGQSENSQHGHTETNERAEKTSQAKIPLDVGQSDKVPNKNASIVTSLTQPPLALRSKLRKSGRTGGISNMPEKEGDIIIVEQVSAESTGLEYQCKENEENRGIHDQSKTPIVQNKQEIHETQNKNEPGSQESSSPTVTRRSLRSSSSVFRRYKDYSIF